jgi:host factor-I protein
MVKITGNEMGYTSPMVKTERPPSLQDTFLEHVRDQKMPLMIFLVNGVKLQGMVTAFDAFTVTLERDGDCSFIYKHAISTIMPAEPIKLFDGPANEPR